ncbi:MAG: peptidase T [Spirochaetia bacterium]|nr:peptidase T [Spirochaetia bacterium]MBP5739622.1 peptidase T [Spirochaetia bacterium]
MADKKIQKELIERFCRYVQIETTSDENVKDRCPTTDGQLTLINLVAEELEAIGVKDVSVDGNGYLRAFIPGNVPRKKVFGFISHADTSPEVSGKNVKPLIHKKYDGKPIKLSKDLLLSPAEYPLLAQYRGKTIITSDGTTLLGADDKAGIAEIVTAASYLLSHPEIKRNSMEIFITPDEEIGQGTDHFPLDKIKAHYLYTVDGDAEGCIESECFNAYSAKLKIKGVSIHPGSGKGKLVNATLLGSEFLSMLPKSEMPETTEGREGFFCPVGITGTIEECQVSLILRDFDAAGMERRIKMVEQAAETLKKNWPAAQFELEIAHSYSNMKEYVDKNKKCLSYLEQAVEKTGIKPVHKLIRGGTDGSRLSELGHPCPNIFTGGQNFHGRLEWAAVPAMERSVQVIINLVCTGIKQ